MSRIGTFLLVLFFALFRGPSAAWATATTIESASPRPEITDETSRKVETKLPQKAAEDLREHDVVAAAGAMEPVPKDGNSKSIVPLAGYDPTYGGFVGAGYFAKRTKDSKDVSSWGLFGIISQKQAASQLQWIGDHQLPNSWKIEWHNEFNNGFESNYGEGNETQVQNRVDVPMWEDQTDVILLHYFSDHFAIGPVIDQRMRRNKHRTQYDIDREVNPLAPKEYSVGAGFIQRIDFRNIAEDPNLGWKEQLRAVFVHPYGGPIRNDFPLIDFELDTFEYLMNRNFVLANSLSGGIAFGQPTFMDEFRIGGSHKLRGYYHNRFRGSRYYTAQSELRYPIFKLVSGASFLEFGEATDRSFGHPHLSYGSGLRIGIPPDEVSKIRIDYAFGYDQHGITVDFGHAF